ncbi:MAG: glycerate kinase [Humibacillus sp.]|nr:glycerate kinase [Humibacillus sp.]MDN5779553.1 glycerate kinase [Humibacillus sp.]
MHVLIAPCAFSGALSAGQAATAMAQGWSQAAPHDVLAAVPICDGGPGFVEAVAATAGGRLHACVTTDPLGRSVPATILLAEVAGRPTAYVESAQAIGVHLLAADERDPTRTTSFGVGALLSAALDLGATRIVIGLGGSGTNDAGAGLLSAVGVGSRARLGCGGLALLETRDDDLHGLEAARDRFIGIDLVVATDTEGPLLGLKGTSALFAVGKGASEQQAQDLENAIGHFVSVVSRVRPPAKELLSGALLRPEREPGAGAAGGLGYSLGLLGARRMGGVQGVLDAVGFDALLAAADLVVTGEGRFDWESLHGPVAQVAAAAGKVGVPAVVVAGEAVVGRREAMASGLSGVYAVAERRNQVDAALADPAGTLTARTARVARTWSPARS